MSDVYKYNFLLKKDHLFTFPSEEMGGSFPACEFGSDVRHRHSISCLQYLSFPIVMVDILCDFCCHRGIYNCQNTVFDQGKLIKILKNRRFFTYSYAYIN